LFSSASYTFTTTGWITHTFSSGFFWDGTSNLLVDFCHDNTSGTATSCYTAGPSFLVNTTAFNSAFQIHADGAGSYCNSATGGSSSNNGVRPNFQIAHSAPPPMIFVSSTSTTSSVLPVIPGSTNNQVIGMQVVTS
jgi:hypothetical protein